MVWMEKSIFFKQGQKQQVRINNGGGNSDSKANLPKTKASLENFETLANSLYFVDIGNKLGGKMLEEGLTEDRGWLNPDARTTTLRMIGKTYNKQTGYPETGVREPRGALLRRIMKSLTAKWNTVNQDGALKFVIDMMKFNKYNENGGFGGRHKDSRPWSQYHNCV